ncbi:H-NS histone family protein [Stenotrophomonas muris]|uniref:H-NS histone family protein n=1 Tax=Stenotrophomonas muris TaxID=2963283 RepID=UPI00383B34C8
MKNINLSRMSSRDLGQLIRDAKRQQAVVAKRKPLATVRAKLTKLAKAEGYSIQELFGGATAPATKRPTPRKGKAVKRPGAKVPPKYRNPMNAQETWTGRGRQPRWVENALNVGATLESLLIQQEETSADTAPRGWATAQA